MFRSLILILSTTLLLSVVAAEGGDHGEDSPLYTAMKAANDGYKVIRRAARKDALVSDEVKAAVDTLIASMSEAKQHEPEIIAAMPADQQAAAREDYAQRMDALLADLQALKQALAAGDSERAKALAGKLGGHKKEGHDRYIPEDE